MAEIILTVLLFMYWLGEAATEAYTHMSKKRKISNPVIKNSEYANGLFDYHTWRTIEYAGIIATILYLLPPELRWSYAGMTLIAWFFYQRLLGYALRGELFPRKSPYGIGSLIIPHPKWLDWGVLLLGASTILANENL